MAPSTNTRILRAKHLTKAEVFTKDHLKTVQVEFDSTLNEGEILVRNLYLSLDPCRETLPSTAFSQKTASTARCVFTYTFLIVLLR